MKYVITNFLKIKPKNIRSCKRSILRGDISKCFIEDEVDSIHVQGNATSTYYLREKGEKKGANRVSGDIIDIWVSDDRIAWIYVEGGTEGVYYPQHLERRVESDEEELPVLGSEP